MPSVDGVRRLFAPFWRVAITAAGSPLADALLFAHSFRMQRDVSFFLQLMRKDIEGPQLQKSNEITLSIKK